MRTLYIIILYLNIPLALASFFFAAVMLSRAYRAFRFGRHDSIYFNFGMSLLFLGLWIFHWLLTLFKVPSGWVVWNGALSYIFGLWILHFFTLFTHYYPIPYSISLRRKLFYYAVSAIFVFIFLLFPTVIIKSAVVDFPFIDEELNIFGLFAYTTYFVALSFISLANLLHKYRTIGGMHSEIIKKITIVTFVAIIINLFTSVTSVYLINFEATAIGVLATAGVLFYIYKVMYGNYP